METFVPFKLVRVNNICILLSYLATIFINALTSY